MSEFSNELLLTMNSLLSSTGKWMKTDKIYDPELLYVECRNCGRPVIWEPGKTTALLQEAEINLEEIDEQCMLVAESCPACTPDILAVKVQVVRLGSTTDNDLEYVKIDKGHA